MRRWETNAGEDMNGMLNAELLRLIPQQPQQQSALDSQLHDLVELANRFGLCDAADYIRRTLLNSR